MHLTSIVLTALLAYTPTLVSGRKAKEAILLSKVKSLTVRDGHDTSHRRVEAMPQLTCVGGSAQGLYNVDVMRCENAGAEYDAEDIQWTCKAALPPEFKLGSTDVICEGYDNADDPYVLKGSCAVEYRLVLTELGEQKYKQHIQETFRVRKPKIDAEKQESSGDRAFAVIFWLIFAAIVFAILYNILFPSDHNRRGFGDGHRIGFNGGGGDGGGGPDDHDDPPPPYTPQAQPKVKKSSSNAAGSAPSSGNQQQGGYRPGYWTGAATGAAAGYAAGTWNANRNNRTRASEAGPSAPNRFLRDPSAAQERNENESLFGSFWGSRSNNVQARSSPRQRPNNAPSWGGSGGSSSSSAPTPSSSRQESTGFGGTTRR